jgi:hypothetical protein
MLRLLVAMEILFIELFPGYRFLGNLLEVPVEGSHKVNQKFSEI